MSSAHDPVIIAARRTPNSTRGRFLAAHDAATLGAVAIRAAVDDARSVAGSPVDVADVILGNCMGPGGNLGRVAALAAGLGTHVPGGTVDRQCGSGLAAIIDAANAIRAGDSRIRVAGGVESPSTAPVRVADGVPYARAPFAPHGYPDPDMLRAAEDLAVVDGISRRRQEAYALRSHARAAAAMATGRFDTEIAPVGRATLDDVTDARASVFERLAPLFPDGSVTAGTSTRVGDGSAAVVLAQAGTAPGLALRASALIGCDPALPGVGAAHAIDAALNNLGAAVTDVDAFEIVEAFAAQSLAVLDRLGIAEDDERVNADGGSLALGHPWGATAAISCVRLFTRLVRGGRPPGTLGVAAASVGGGLGVAAVFEVVR